uniref:Phospholipase A2-like domain-containing protein n=1 Tax=Parvoviridae sp. TaxID=1940570 RepID=A0A893A4V8_9VIRU|nr:MAG: hypothetical protein 4 [Parvoviridae sp.]
MAEAFELIRRVGGSRIQYQIRTTGGTFKTVPGADYQTALNAAQENIPIDISEGAVNLDEYLEFERNNPNPFDEFEHFEENADLEEINLEDISPTTESTPLLESALAEAGGVSAVGTAAAPSTSAILTGLGVGTAIVGTGIGIGVATSNRNNNDNSHKNPVVSLPGHRYIGPGNTIDHIPPVDTDDAIARQHDIDYSKSQNPEDINRADDIGVIQFVNDFQETGNIHSVIGAAGLGIKRTFDTVTGNKLQYGLGKLFICNYG